MELSLILLGIGHFFGLTILFAATSTSDYVGNNIVTCGNLNPDYATFPISFLIGSTAVIISPAGVIMNKVGYKKIFVVGTIFGIIGSAICVGALLAPPTAGLILYIIGLIPQGFAYGIVNYYRHVAALMGGLDEGTKSRYIAIVITSGALAGVAGPGMASLTQYLIPGREFLGTYIFIGIIEILHFIVIIFTKLNLSVPQNGTVAVKKDNLDAKPRSFFTVVTQFQYIYAFITGTTAHGLMILIMGITPLVLKNRFAFLYSAFIVEAHVVCMYIPSFFTSKLIARFTASYISLVGVIITSCGAAIYLVNDGDMWHEYAAIATSMAVIGIGWNLSFVCATTMLTGAYKPQEKFKAQAFNDTCLFGLGAVLSLISGTLLQVEGVKYIIVGCLITYTCVAVINTVFILVQKSAKQQQINDKM